MVKLEEVLYNHTCIVQRSTGRVNPETLEEEFDILYEGKCGLQYASNGNTSMQGYTYQTFPTVMLPVTTIRFATNDEVVVSTDNGRTQRFTVEQPEVCDLKGLEVIHGTTLWLKLGEDGGHIIETTTVHSS